jgi:apolipoprotein D and lipocalin family protein
MSTLLRISGTLVLSMILGAAAQAFTEEKKEVQVVAHVDLARYVGTWYEIAAFPQIFEWGCYGSTATYSARPDGKIDVLNSCRQGSLEGRQRDAKGVAWVEDATTNAKLRVQFFRPITAPYWVIDLGQNYEYSVVATPNRKYLWILSRTPQMDETLFNQLVARAAAQGFKTDRLVKTPQP